MPTATVHLQQIECTPRVPRGLRARMAQWFARRQMATLLVMDDHALRDMGITREDVHHARQLPLSVDAGEALNRIALSRGPNM